MKEIDEESIGIDSPDGGDGITCRVGTTTSTGGRSRTARIHAEPGNAIRVSVAFQGANKRNKSQESARILAFIDPITGAGVVRMGLYKNGKEEGKQIVWQTDFPIWKGNK